MARKNNEVGIKLKQEKGVIYILTNPSFKEYVKIGYADDVKKLRCKIYENQIT